MIGLYMEMSRLVMYIHQIFLLYINIQNIISVQ